MTEPNQAPTMASEAHGIRPVTDREFGLFQKLIYREAGIHLAATKKPLLEARLTRRLRDLGLKSFDAYYRHLVNNGGGSEIVLMLDRIATNQTHFFREPQQFAFIGDEILPAWMAKGQCPNGTKHIRVWSAACSTGEEPYSIAMTLHERFAGAAGWSIEIVASDLSTRVLSAAQKAVWPIAKTSEIPQDYLRKYMLRGTGSQAGKMKAGPELRGLIHFQRVNLNDERYAVAGPFDLIFCRNVLIYFDAQSRAKVIERLVDRLAPQGFLFIGHAESLTGLSDRVRYVAPTIYRHTGQPQPAPPAAKKQRQGLEQAP